MQITTFHQIVTAGFLCIAAQTAHGADWETHVFTNETIVANSHTVISALFSGGDQNEARVQALVGSQVAFRGCGLPSTNHPASLLISSNIFVDVELLPAREVRPLIYPIWEAEVLGTLKSVDFEKRVIHIQAKPEDWRVVLESDY